MSARPRPLSTMGVMATAAAMAALVLLGPAVADTPGAQARGGKPATEAASWQAHSYQFHFMGFTSTYSCDGLADKLKLLLRLAGARADAKVEPLCARGFGVPDKLVEAKVEFSSLQSAPAAGPATSVAGLWKHVEIAPRHPFDLQTGDCELIEQFRDALLPMFSTRNVKSQISCVPHQESGSNFSLSFDVLAAVPAAKSP